MKRAIVIVLLISAMLLTVTAAPFGSHASVSAQEAPVTGGTLNIATTVDADSLDPHESIGLAARDVQAHIYDRLVYIDAEGLPQPWLATDWTVSDDGLTITFNLVTDRTFTDGTPVNAAAVKYTFDRMLEPERASSAATQFPQMELEVLDDYTVQFVLAEPFAPFFNSLANAAGGIISPDAAEAEGPNFGQNPVGSGPFMLESWEKDTQLTLVRNPDYSTIREDMANKGPAYLDRVVYQTVVEASTRVNAIQAGDVQVATGSYAQAEQFVGNPDIQLIVKEQGVANVNFIVFTQVKPPFDEPLLRQAVGYAVDPQELIDVAYYGYATRNPTMIPTGVPGHNPAIGEELGFVFDPDRARALLDEAGWVPGADGIREKDGQRLEVELLSWTSTTIDTLTQILQAQLMDVGIDVRINLMEAGTFLAVGKENNQHLVFMRTTWPEPIILSRTLKDGGTFGSFEHPELNALLDDAASTIDWDERQALLDEVNRMVLAEALTIPLFSDNDIYLVRSNVHDFRWDPSGWLLLGDTWLSE